MNRKTILSIMVVLVLLLAIGWGVFWFLNRKPVASAPSATPKPTAAPTPQSTPLSGGPRFDILATSSWPMGVAVDRTGKVVFFDKVSGQFKTVQKTLNVTHESLLWDSAYTNIDSVQWSPDFTKVAVRYAEYGQERFAIITVSDKTSVTLPVFTRQIAWAPDGTQLAVIHDAPGGLAPIPYLALVNPDGTKEQKLLTLPSLENMTIQFMNADTIILLTKPSPGQLDQRAYLFDIKNKWIQDVPAIQQAFLKRVPNGPLFLFPTLDGNHFLFAETDSHQTTLSLMLWNNVSSDSSSSPIVSVPFATLPNKCAWSSDSESLYCAVTNEFQNGNHLIPFDYWMGKFATNDTFIRFSWRTGELKTYAENTLFDATEVVVAPDQSFLVFVNRRDMGLYKLTFK